MKATPIHSGPLLAAGVGSGLLQVTAGVAMYLAGFYFDPRSLLISLSVLILGIVLGTRFYQRKTRCGGMPYRQALIIGTVIGVSTGLVYAAYNLISISFVYPDFLREVINARLANLEAGGMPTSLLNQELQKIEATTTAGTIALMNLLALSVLGAGVSALASVWLKRPASTARDT